MRSTANVLYGHNGLLVSAETILAMYNTEETSSSILFIFSMKIAEKLCERRFIHKRGCGPLESNFLESRRRKGSEAT